MSVKKKSKMDFVESVYNDIHPTYKKIRKAEVKIIFESIMHHMKSAIIEGNQIELRGFGVFEFRYRKPKTNARNPKTGEKIKVAGHTVVAFKSGHDLKNAVWNSNFGNKDSVEQ